MHDEVSIPVGSFHVTVGTHACLKFHEERESFVGSRHGPWISEKGGVFQHDLHGFYKKQNLHVFPQKSSWKGVPQFRTDDRVYPLSDESDPAGSMHQEVSVHHKASVHYDVQVHHEVSVHHKIFVHFEVLVHYEVSLHYEVQCTMESLCTFHPVCSLNAPIGYHRSTLPEYYI